MATPLLYPLPETVCGYGSADKHLEIASGSTTANCLLIVLQFGHHRRGVEVWKDCAPNDRHHAAIAVL